MLYYLDSILKGAFNPLRITLPEYVTLTAATPNGVRVIRNGDSFDPATETIMSANFDENFFSTAKGVSVGLQHTPELPVRRIVEVPWLDIAFAVMFFHFWGFYGLFYFAIFGMVCKLIWTNTKRELRLRSLYAQSSADTAARNAAVQQNSST